MMLETITNDTAQLQQKQARSAASDKAILKMKSHDRMGGSSPVWEKPTTAQDKVAQRLDMAGKKSFESYISTAAFAEHTAEAPSHITKPFGFGDIVDMVNPLHHLPIVGGMYRDATGDDIRGISKIMGGALFGGPAGAAGSAVNVAVEDKTGADLIGHVKNSITQADSAEKASQYAAYQFNAIEPGSQNTSQNTLQNASSGERDMKPQEELRQLGREFISKNTGYMGTLVEIDDMKLAFDKIYEKVESNRMGGSMYREVENIRELLPAREPISKIEISSYSDR